MNNRKLIDDEEKEDAHRQIWKNIFKISQEENAQYGRDKEDELEEFLIRHQEKCNIY